MKWKFIIVIVALVLSGCAFTNQWLDMSGDRGTRIDLPVNIEELVEMATYCKDIYDNSLYEIRNNEYAYNVIENRGVTIIIFRGTNNRENIITDLDFRVIEDEKLDVELHRGFRYATEKLYNEIIKKYELEQTIYLTGHSLGGAIAQIMGLWFEEDGYEVQIYTFGSPKISNTDFGDDVHFRVYLEDDPVPYLPPFPYIHWGVRINAETLIWEERHPVEDFMKINAQDHSIIEYLNILKRHLVYE